MPIVVLLAASLQGVAAVMNGLAVWRTVGMVGESRVVTLVAAIAVYVCARDWISGGASADLQQGLLFGG